MSVLRRAKLRTPDGTESIEYPLGVEAENVEVANQENLSQRLVRIDEDLKKRKEDITIINEIAGTNKQNIGAAEVRIDALERRSASVDKKPYYFNTVADMKAYQKLIEGDMAITLGYHEINDGGGAEYNILSGNYTDDGGSYHQLDNNLFAELIIKNNEINVKYFGAYGDGEHDDTTFIQNGINLGYKLVFDDSIYMINTTGLLLIDNSYLKFNNTTLKMITNNSAGYKILNITKCNNVCLDGNVYLIGDRETHTGSSGEYGHCIQILGSKNIKIDSINCSYG